MTFEAQMHVASLEVVAALFAVAAIASRMRPRRMPEIGSLTPVRLTLEIRQPSGPRTFTALCPISIGRAGDSDLAVDDAEASRRHARLECENGVPFLRDVGSSNGTYLNGRLLDQVVEVRLGDEIDVGTTRLTVRAIEEVWT